MSAQLLASTWPEAVWWLLIFTKGCCEWCPRHSHFYWERIGIAFVLVGVLVWFDNSQRDRVGPLGAKDYGSIGVCCSVRCYPGAFPLIVVCLVWCGQTKFWSAWKRGSRSTSKWTTVQWECDQNRLQEANQKRVHYGWSPWNPPCVCLFFYLCVSVLLSRFLHRVGWPAKTVICECYFFVISFLGLVLAKRKKMCIGSRVYI